MITSEDVYPVIDSQVQDFIRIYNKTKVTNLRSSTRDAIVQLLNDSVKLIVSSREFNAEEKNIVERNSLEVSSTKIAYDGIAVLSNTKNDLSRITIEELKWILTGKIDRWSKVKESNLTSAIVVGIGDINSGVYEYVKHRIAQDSTFASTVVQCASSSDVISFVHSHPNAIGFVGISWLNQQPDDVRALAIGDPAFKSDSTSNVLEYFAPYQAHIYRNFYPLSRAIYVYVHNAGKGVALGFTSFAAGNQGQKIIVKNGLVPATLPVRLVQLNNPLEKE